MNEGVIDAVLLAGPTASGKSAIALSLAQALGGTVINTDSMQVYRDLAIITARPTPEEEAIVPHRLYGHIDAAINHSVGRWLDEAATAIADCRAEGRLPILTGGTGLYFRAAERGLAAMPAVPEAVREKVRTRATHVPPAELHRQLALVDPASAERLRPTDPQRLLRALEVFEATGRSLTEWQSAPHSAPILPSERCLRLFLAPERGPLYARIDKRFETMMRTGALEEVAALGARGLDPTLPAMRAHGVPWLLKAIAGMISVDTAVAHAKADTRHYAKRQFTWFRHQMPGWQFVAPEDAEGLVRAAFLR
jgi:tRNA dimethylallyltransferase